MQTFLPSHAHESKVLKSLNYSKGTKGLVFGYKLISSRIFKILPFFKNITLLPSHKAA